jgi:hypothetical protein
VLRLISERRGLGKRALAWDVGCSQGSLRYHVLKFDDARLIDADVADEGECLILSELVTRMVALLPAEQGAPACPPGPVAV